jgi:dihydroxyacetone kinase-like protein
MAKVLHDNEEYLTKLDSAIGDADHGINMNRGFQAVARKLPELRGEDIGTVLQAVGMTLVSTVGGASGPLYGTAFMQAGAVLKGKSELLAADILAAFNEAYEGVLMRGKAKRGDKTMVDALSPAVNALRGSLDSGSPIAEALEIAEGAAEAGMKATIPMPARKGRASYLGERSVGHQDPGATSTYLLIKTMAEMAHEGGP